MKYSIVAKDNGLTRSIKRKIIENIEGDYDEANPDIVFTVGGDGTVLDAVRKYIHLLEEVKFITINTGNVGFYTEFLPEDVNDIINKRCNMDNIISYPLIEFSVDGKLNYALNEVVFSVTRHLFEGKIKVDGTDLMDVRSDGGIILTPSGSTAYNQSLKGAVVDRGLELIQLIVIAPFETAKGRVISPLILNKNREVIIKPLSNYFDVSFDRNFITYQSVENISVRLSNKKVNFLKNNTQNFPKRLKEKFI